MAKVIDVLVQGENEGEKGFEHIVLRTDDGASWQLVVINNKLEVIKLDPDAFE